MAGENDKAGAQFNLELQQWLDRMPEEQVLPFQRDVGLRAFVGVVQRSPVDTGRFRNGWTISTQPSDTVPEGFDLAPFGSPPSSQSENAALSALLAVQPFEDIYVQNALPYGGRLENGYSKQAPAGMVSITVAELRDYIAESRGTPE